MRLLEKIIFFALCLYAIFAPHSIFLAEAAVIVGLLAWAGKAVILRKKEGKWSWPRGNLAAPIIFFCAIGLVSLLTAYDRFQALKQIKSYWLFLFYFLVINNIPDRKSLLRIVNILVISTFVAASYGLFKYFFNHTMAVEAFIKNVITLAGFFLLILPLSFGLFVGEETAKKKTIYLLAAFFILLGLIFTLERSVWLGLGVEILTFLWLNKRSRKVLVLGIVMVALIVSFSKTLRERFKTLGHLRSYSITSRFHQWQSGLEMMFDHPLTGVGPGNYESVYWQYKFFEERKTYPHAHSNIVQLGAETGILGLGVFFWMMVAAVRTMLGAVKEIRDRMFASLALGVLAAFIGFHFAGLFEYNFGDSEVQLLFWFMVAGVERMNSGGIRI